MIENKNNPWTFPLPLIISSGLAIALFSFLGINRSIWLDEASSILKASHNFEGIIRNVCRDGHPPLYYFFLAIWVRVFGISELAIRTPSVMFYILSLVAVYVLGKSVYNERKTALLCSLLYMLSPLAIIHAQNAKAYSLLGLLAILSTLFFLRLFLIKTNSKKDIALYIIVNILGTFTHYWFFFVVLSQIVSYILLFSRMSFKKFSITIFMSVTPFLILWLPIFLSQVDSGTISWIQKPIIIQALVYNLLDFFGGVGWERPMFVYAAFLTLIVLKVEGFKIRFWNITALKGFITQKQNIVFLTFMFVSLLVPLIISQVKPIYVIRYTIITLHPFVLLVGSLLSRFGNKHIVLACCYILLIETSISFVSYRTTPKRCSDKSTTEYLIKHANNNDILIHTSLSKVPIDYYLRLMKPDKRFIELSFPQELALHPGWRDVNKMLSQKQMLESEADSVVSYIDDILIKNNNTKIWVLYGGNVEIGKILKKRLDTHFFLREVKDLQGELHYTFDNDTIAFSLRTEKVLRRPFYNYVFRDDSCTFYSMLYVYQIFPIKT